MAEARRLRVTLTGGTAPWVGTYVRTAEGTYSREVQGVQPHELRFLSGVWLLMLGEDLLARQKDLEGPLTGGGRRPWKFKTTDETWHARPMEVEAIEDVKEEETSDSDDARLQPLPIGRGRGRGGAGGGRGAGSPRAGGGRGAGADIGVDGLPGVAIVRSVGFDRAIEDMDAGEDVLVRIRVVAGPAVDWEIQGRLWVDRHKNKATGRSTRWVITSPSGQNFETFNSNNPRLWSVEHHGGQHGGRLPAEAFEQLRGIKDELRRRLAGRRNALQDAGKLINDEVEAVWQELLQARDAGASVQTLKRLRADWASTVPAAQSLPEWGPAEWNLDRALPRAFTRQRKRRSGGGGGGSGPGGGGLPRNAARPLWRRPRDEFLGFVTRKLREEAASAAAAAGGGNASESEAGSSEGASGAEAAAARKRPRPGPGRSPGAEGPAAAAEAAGAEAATEAPGGSADEDAMEDADQQLEEPVGAGQASEPPVRREAPLRHLLLDGRAAEDTFMNSEYAVVWERLVGGAVGAAGDGGEGFTLGDCNIAWRYAVALAVLGRADFGFQNSIVDLLRESQRHGMPPGAALARLLVVKDALVKGSDGSLSAFANVLRPLVVVGLREPHGPQPGAQERLESKALLGLLTTSARRAAEAAADALQQAITSEAPVLCGFAALLCAGAEAKVLAAAVTETVQGLLLPTASWPCWRRGLAALLGAAMAGCEQAAEAIVRYVREDRLWPNERPPGEKWALWLLLAASPFGERALATPKPKPALDFALPLWEQVLQGGSRHLRRVALRLVATAAPLVPLDVGKDIVDKVSRGQSRGESLTKVMSTWGTEASLLRELAEQGVVDLKAKEERTRLGKYSYFAGLAAVQLRTLAPERCSAASGGSPADAATACLVDSLRLQIAPGAGSQADQRFRCMVETNYGCPLERGAWPMVLPSNTQRFHKEGEGPHFLSGGQFGHLRGQTFSKVYEDRAIVKWMLEAHLGDWRPVGAPEVEAEPHARNEEVNRFARWLLNVFAGDAPLLRLPRPPAEGAAAVSPEQELRRASLRAALTCRGVFVPLLSGLLQQRGPGAAAAASQSSAAAAGGAVQSWLRAAALAAALRAGCLGLADPDEGRGEETGHVADAAQEVLGLLAQSLPGGDAVGGGHPANTAVAQAAKLEGVARSFVLGAFARDVNFLLLWLQRLGHAGEVRAVWLFRLVAVASRHLRGNWPPPPACPAEASFADALRYNPLRDSAPPGSLPELAVSSRLLALRPLSALLAHCTPPAAEAGASLASFRGLEAAVAAWRPDAQRPSPEERETQFGAWAEALSGSDAEDFARLRTWRSHTFAAAPGVVGAHLAAAVSSRCAAVHAVNAVSRARRRNGPAPITSLLVLLLRDFGEAGGADALEAHHHVVKWLLAGSQAEGVDHEHVWATRHLLYRYIALDKLVGALEKPQRDALPAEVRLALRHLHDWVVRNAFAMQETAKVLEVARGFAGDLAKLACEELDGEVIAEEIAPPPRNADGCFNGVADVRAHGGKEVVEALWAASKKSALEALA